MVVQDRRVLIGSFLIILLTLISFKFIDVTGQVAKVRDLGSNLEETIITLSPVSFEKSAQVVGSRYTQNYGESLGYLNVNLVPGKNGVYDEAKVYLVNNNGKKSRKITKTNICADSVGNTITCKSTIDFAILLSGDLVKGDYKLCVMECTKSFGCSKEQYQKEVCSEFKIV